MINTTSTEAPSKPGGSDDTDAIFQRVVDLFFFRLIAVDPQPAEQPP